jgi:hypothetical protein
MAGNLILASPHRRGRWCWLNEGQAAQREQLFWLALPVQVESN